MHALRLHLLALAVVVISVAGGTDLPKTNLSDSELRGPVRQCVARTIYVADGTLPERSFTQTSVYSPSGRLLQGHKKYSSGPDYVTTYTYDDAGRLPRKSSGSDEPCGDTTFTYDDKGQLLSVSSSTGNPTVTYEQDLHGRKRRVEHFPVLTLAPNTAIAAIPWEESDLHFAPPSGGAVTTIHDEHERPVEGQVNDASGRLMMRIVRTYDEEGRIQGDKLIPEDMEGNVPEELVGQLNDAQKKAVRKFIANAFATGESAYKYDPHGRVIEKHRAGGVFGDELTKIAYNDHGDVSDEVTIRTDMPGIGAEFGMGEVGNMVLVSESKRPAPSRTEIRYTYEYDTQGNWTKKTTSVRQEQGEFKTSTIINRTFSYY